MSLNNVGTHSTDKIRGALKTVNSAGISVHVDFLNRSTRVFVVPLLEDADYHAASKIVAEILVKGEK